jgi:hypothetical protein
LVSTEYLLNYRFLIVSLAVLAAGFVVAGCGDKALSAAEEQKMKDSFAKPPKIEDLPPDERARIQGMIDAQRGGASKPAPSGQ